MFKKIRIVLLLSLTAIFSGCATVPMAPQSHDEMRKQFKPPTNGMAGLYIYRNSPFGHALKKNISIDGKVIGESANEVYFYHEVRPGSHVLATESEFSDNSLRFDAGAGKNYFFEQYIKLGVFVGGANVRQKSTIEGKRGVQQCRLAKSFDDIYGGSAKAMPRKEIVEAVPVPASGRTVAEEVLDDVESSLFVGANEDAVVEVNEDEVVEQHQDDTDKPIPPETRRSSSKPKDIVACKDSYSYLFGNSCK